MPISAYPSITIVGSDRERRSYKFFIDQFGQNLLDALRLDKLRRLVLQLSHRDPSITACIVALGSLGEFLLNNDMNSFQKQNAIKCHQFAIGEYCKSLKHLRQQLQDEPNRPRLHTLITCFLFTVFEFLQGNEFGALAHLRSGLKILHRSASIPVENFLQFGSATDPLARLVISQAENSVLTKHDPHVVEMIRIFTVMENQAIFWLGLDSWDFPLLVFPEHDIPAPRDASYFDTVEEAGVALEFLVHRNHDIRRWMISNEMSKSATDSEYRRQELINQLQQWLSDTDKLQRRLDRPSDDDLVLRLNAMRMSSYTTRVMLEVPSEHINTNSSQVVELALSTVVTLAKTILFPLDGGARQDRIKRVVWANNPVLGDSNASLFKFPSGIIQSLYIAAVKCSNEAVAVEAIELLTVEPWRESGWDSYTLAAIAVRSRRRGNTYPAWELMPEG